MSGQVELLHPITDGGILATNFFNGRLLTGEDLSRDQTARREALRRVGLALGEGIAYGLEVAAAAGATGVPVLTVQAGLAVNRRGQVLRLEQTTEVKLLERSGGAASASNVFGDCRPLAAGSYIAGYGFYLLVLSPATSNAGRAPTYSLNQTSASCNTDTVRETVQFRALPMEPFMPPAELAALNQNPQLRRNLLAYLCFGVAQTQAAWANPLGGGPASYGLLDAMRGASLTDCDVPLAVLHWTSTGLQFVDMWAARRELRPHASHAFDPLLAPGRREAETQAMIFQFAEHIEALRLSGLNLPTLAAANHFKYLPPAGWLPIGEPDAWLPIANAGDSNGFTAATFFGQRASRELATLDGAQWRGLLNEALSHEPLELRPPQKVQLYLLWENVQAVESGAEQQLTLIFASPALAHRGVSRFGYAAFDRSHVAPAVF